MQRLKQESSAPGRRAGFGRGRVWRGRSGSQGSRAPGIAGQALFGAVYPGHPDSCYTAANTLIPIGFISVQFLGFKHPFQSLQESQQVELVAIF